MRLMQEAGLAPPTLKVQAGFVTVTFSLPTSLAPRMQDDTPGKTSGKTSGKILAEVRENAQITIPELAALLGISTRSVERQLRQLQDLHRLKRIGAAKGGYWQVIDT